MSLVIKTGKYWSLRVQSTQQACKARHVKYMQRFASIPCPISHRLLWLARRINEDSLDHSHHLLKESGKGPKQIS